MTTTTAKNIPDAIVVDVQGLSKTDLNSIFPFYNTINNNPVQLGDKNYGAATLRFVTLLDAKISTGNNPNRTFEAKAIFQLRGANPHTGLSRVDWLPLFLLLWQPVIEATVIEAEEDADTETES